VRSSDVAMGGEETDRSEQKSRGMAKWGDNGKDGVTKGSDNGKNVFFLNILFMHMFYTEMKEK